MRPGMVIQKRQRERRLRPGILIQKRLWGVRGVGTLLVPVVRAVLLQTASGEPGRRPPLRLCKDVDLESVAEFICR